MEYKELIEYALKFHKDIQEIKSKMPYSMNVIDLLHANENAHSRILLWLLKYKRNDRYILLESFFKMLSKFVSLNLNINDPYLNCEEKTDFGRRVDLFITNRAKDFCVIIENKINGAGDQDKQLEDYIADAINRKIDSKKIVVIYLTLSGEKFVSNGSLTKWAKEKLGYNDENNGRFLPLSYEHDILPWLEEEVLPHTEYKETILISALTQYIDYLKGILNIRNNQQNINKYMEQKLNEDLKLKSYEEIIQLRKSIEEVENATNDVLTQKINMIATEKVIKPLVNFLSKQHPSFSIDAQSFSLNYFHIKIKNPHWSKCKICFNEEGGIIYGVVHDNADVNHIDNETEKRIKENIGGFRYSKWWPIWKWVDKDFKQVDEDFWGNIANGDKDVASYIIDKIDEVVKALEGYQL